MLNIEKMKKQNEIIKRKAQLQNNDYKIIKCYEYSLCSKAAPYDIAALHTENEAARAAINKFQADLKKLGG